MQLHQKNLKNILPWASIISEKYGSFFYSTVFVNNDEKIEKYFSIEYLDGLVIYKKNDYWRCELLLNNLVPAKYVRTISNPGNLKLKTYYDAVYFSMKIIAIMINQKKKKNRKSQSKVFTWNDIDIEINSKELKENLKELPINLSNDNCVEFFSYLQKDLVEIEKNTRKNIFEIGQEYLRKIYDDNDVKTGIFNFCMDNMLTNGYTYYPDPITVECIVNKKIFKKIELDIIKEMVEA